MAQQCWGTLLGGGWTLLCREHYWAGNTAVLGGTAGRGALLLGRGPTAGRGTLLGGGAKHGEGGEEATGPGCTRCTQSQRDGVYRVFRYLLNACRRHRTSKTGQDLQYMHPHTCTHWASREVDPVVAVRCMQNEQWGRPQTDCVLDSHLVLGTLGRGLGWSYIYTYIQIYKALGRWWGPHVAAHICHALLLLGACKEREVVVTTCSHTLQR